jgi:hypothetical protein
MTEDKGKVELEKVKKAANTIAVIGGTIVLLGLVILFVGLIQMNTWMFPDNEHITDQNLPIKDVKNATYTWTSEEIKHSEDQPMGLFYVGGVIAVVGAAIMYTAVIIEPSKTKIHEIGCKGDGDKKYCSECGLKLSRLKKE